LESKSSTEGTHSPESEALKAEIDPVKPEDQEVALSVLEADQLVAAKERTRFGRRTLSRREKLLLWGLRIYVVVMLFIVLMSVLRAVRGAR
jgi:hypothetical protein